MNREIEEMAHLVCERDAEDLCTLDRKQCDLKCTSGDIAKHLYSHGYRKSTDVAREIFEGIKQHLEKQIKAILMFGKDDDDFYSGELHALNVLQNYIKAVKKKYESEGADDGLE